MRFSTGLFTSLFAVQAVVSTPVPTPKTPTAVSVGLSVVQDALGTLETEKALLVGFVEKEAVPVVKTSLHNIIGAVQDIKDKVTPYVVGIAKPLTEDEIANVLVLLGKTKSLLGGLKDYTTTLLSGLSKESQKAVKAELIFLLSLVEPAIIPIETLAKSAAIQSTGATKDQINTALTDVKYGAGAALKPILDAIAKL